MNKESKKLDLNQLAKRIVDETIGDALPEEETNEKKKAALDKKRLKENKEKTITESE
jgi:hypothetical protein